ncbi:signal peptide peptidase SppA [Myroides marinus]|uniref:signal peptide peptidase SppA n=1 Tax=Myroides marinus TaxID=703342 RepID=UPI0025769F30|nr:signal peptide peptidase SppA [Myroides marinus]MDM1348597.1 signal peptide peptidase SppA [Myroides marinus]MDM1352237.1 signal peptide peptidase SppA [Myroides marinus]MDM1355698.1 signal peptide peptidase SppA [Myroides marinus]MDM1359443.1 signal peptide peptidase SppA [Myroides marinus]MDM1361231.1 signal peptide peptidase SppA [Myroides marinus]
MKFLRNVLATIVGLFIFFGVLFFGMLAVGAAMGSSSDKVVVKDNSVINLDLSGVKYDYAGKFNYKDFGFVDAGKDGVADILAAIEYAKTDDRIKGISILNDESSLGVVQKREIRKKLEEFKKTGKFVLAYANTYSQGEYYLNSVADTVYVNPVGTIDFKGLSTEILYLKGLQDKTGVQMEVMRHGKYKSAVEPYLQDKMSDANREQITVFLNSIWETIVEDISKSRKVPVEKLNEIANNLEARTPSRALKAGLVDKVAYEDEYHAAIKKALKVEGDVDYNTIDILDYAKDLIVKGDGNTAEDQIAVIYAQGQILSGEGSVSYIGEGSINRALKEARKDDKIKAVVLRVNSPGGSALTSELIWREVELTKKVKPVIVSMGDLAASGGYYISCNADRIFADPSTITGSIGVFGMVPNMKTLANKYGVNAEQVKTHDNAANYSLFREVDPGFKMVVTEGIEDIYTTFVKRVADGRKLTVEQVDEIAQGRVWTGKDALKNKLIDELGGLDKAIAYAAKKVEIDSYKVVNFPEYKMKFEDLLRSYLGSSMIKTEEQLIKEKIGEANYEMLERLNYFSNLKGVQAIMPFELKIE